VSFLIVVLSILLLVVLISYFKVNAFLSFLIVSILCGLFLGIDPADIESTIHKGMGDMLGSLVIVILAGSMLGKLVAETGAAQKIATSLMSIFGQSYLQLALMITGFCYWHSAFLQCRFCTCVPAHCISRISVQASGTLYWHAYYCCFVSNAWFSSTPPLTLRLSSTA
jgi:Gnt-I system high-affinity gluconate transporter